MVAPAEALYAIGSGHLARGRIWMGAVVAALLLALAAAGMALLNHSSGKPTHSQHLTEAQWWVSDSHQWNGAWSLSHSDDRVTAPDTPWSQVALSHSTPRQMAGQADEMSGQPLVSWYRLRLPASAMSAALQDARLYIPRWQTVGVVTVYLDGELAWQTRGSRVWNSFNRPIWLDLGGRLRGPGDVTLHIRMASAHGVGGALSSVWVGPADELRPSWRLRSTLQTGLIVISQGAYLVLGLFALVFWLMRRSGSESSYLLCFLMAVCHLLAVLQYLIDEEGISIADDWFSWMTQFGLMGTAVCSLLFLGVVQRSRWPRLFAILMVYTAAILLATLPLWSPLHETMLPLMRLALLPPQIMVFVVACRGAVRLRNASSVLIAAWIALSFPLGFYDLALQSYKVSIEGIYLTPYVYLGLFTLFMVVAFTRYTGALDAAENANAYLAQRLAEQVRELDQTHRRLLSAEREQTLLQERQRLMREMHDGVGSSLMTALRLVERGDPTKLNLAQVLKECIDDLKISIDSLEPVDHDLLALLASLRFRLAPRLDGAGLTLDWSQVHDVPPLSWLNAQSALHILRILQEVLTNIIKHSGAHLIGVSTGESEHQGRPGIHVEITDNGTPFAPPSNQPMGRKGLANVHARAQALGGHVSWTVREDGSGNCFKLWLPVAGALPIA